VKKCRIIIADNSKCFRDGLKNILLNIGNVKIVGEAENGIQLLDLLNKHTADVVFLDVVMPEMDGYEAALAGHRMHPGTRFIAFSSLENPRYLNRMILAGVSGYLTKSSNNLDLLHDIIYGDQQHFFLSPGLQVHNLLFDTQSLVN
jgi:DNA-binding NarL/FixJ family response regulator